MNKRRWRAARDRAAADLFVRDAMRDLAAVVWQQVLERRPLLDLLRMPTSGQLRGPSPFRPHGGRFNCFTSGRQVGKTAELVLPTVAHMGVDQARDASVAGIVTVALRHPGHRVTVDDLRRVDGMRTINIHPGEEKDHGSN